MFLCISLIEKPSEVIWSHLTYTNFIILRFNTQQVLAQHIPSYVIRCYHLLCSFRVDPRYLSLVVLQYHSRTAGCSVSLPHYKLRTLLNTVLLAGAFSPEAASNRPWKSDGVTPLFLKNCVVRLCPWQSPSILRLCPCASNTRLGKDTADFTDLHNCSHLVMEFCTKTTVSAHYSRDPTACCFLKQQFLSESFPKALHTISVYETIIK